MTDFHRYQRYGRVWVSRIDTHRAKHSQAVRRINPGSAAGRPGLVWAQPANTPRDCTQISLIPTGSAKEHPNNSQASAETLSGITLRRNVKHHPRSYNSFGAPTRTRT